MEDQGPNADVEKSRTQIIFSWFEKRISHNVESEFSHDPNPVDLHRPPRSMSLPQELLDEIINYLPSDDRQDKWLLQNCSLVAKSWVNPSQRRLFKTVEVRERDLQWWLDNSPPANEGLLQHVRSLSYVTDTRARRSIFSPGYRIDVLQDYLPFFQQLQHLSLSSVHLPSDVSHQVEIFSAFRHTLSRLSFYHCRVTINALVALINYFPNVNCLDLGRPLYMDDVPAVPLSHLLFPKLHISDCHEDGLGLLDQLSGHGLVFGEVVVDYTSQFRLRTLGRIVGALGVTTKCLRVLPSLAGCMYITRESTVRLAELKATLLQTVRDMADLQYRSPTAESSRN